MVFVFPAVESNLFFFVEFACFRGCVESCFFIPLFHFKGGWVGQRSHRLEVLKRGGHEGHPFSFHLFVR